MLWAQFDYTGRPCFSPQVLNESQQVQRLVRDLSLAATGAGEEPPLRYLVLGSKVPGIWNSRRRSRTLRHADPPPRPRRVDALRTSVLRGRLHQRDAVSAPRHHRGAGARRRAGRRLRGGDVEQSRHRRAQRQVRPARSAVQSVPGHGRLHLHGAPHRARPRRAHDPVGRNFHRRETARDRPDRRAGAGRRRGRDAVRGDRPRRQTASDPCRAAHGAAPGQSAWASRKWRASPNCGSMPRSSSRKAISRRCCASPRRRTAAASGLQPT